VKGIGFMAGDNCGNGREECRQPALRQQEISPCRYPGQASLYGKMIQSVSFSDRIRPGIGFLLPKIPAGPVENCELFYIPGKFRFILRIQAKYPGILVFFFAI
jgi:hypothetical protein